MWCWAAASSRKNTVNEKDYLRSRVCELQHRAEQNEYLTHTGFLTVSEAARAQDILRAEGNRTECVFYGGTAEAERRILCFLPSYMSEEDFFRQEALLGEPVCCIRILPCSRKFAGNMTHRDYLGALMGLGIERSQVGDILISGEECFVFALDSMAGFICEELREVGRTSVKCEKIPLGECHAAPVQKEVSGTVSSDRLDAVAAMVFHISRTRMKEMTDGGNVQVDGRIEQRADYRLLPGSHISVRGYGKFIYDGELAETRKGKIRIAARLFI